MTKFSISVKCLIFRGNELLLLKRSGSSKNNPFMYDLPGGKLDPGEELIDGILREISEETGIQLDDVQFVDVVNQKLEDREIIYLVFRATSTSEPLLSDEHLEARYSAISQLPHGQLVPFLETLSYKLSSIIG